MVAVEAISDTTQTCGSSLRIKMREVSWRAAACRRVEIALVGKTNG